MRDRSETWSKMAARGLFQMETKARIANKDYTAISAPVISRSLMSFPLSVGNCISATLSLSLLTDDEIVAANPITIMGRLTSEGQYSEWLEFGTFFIDQRDTSYEGLISLICYDAMLKANQSYFEADADTVDSTGWPKTMKEVVEEIAYRIGVGIDPRTRINTGSDYVVSVPTGKTMVQVLGYIGACHGGNWIITEENLLRLVPLIPIADETFHIIDADYARIKAGDGSLLAYQLTEETTKLPEQSGEQPSSAISVVHHITDELGQPIVTADGHYLIWAADGQVTAVDGIIDVPVVCGELTTGTSITVTGISASNESGASFTTGNDSGFMLSIESNPYMTQKICDDLCVAFEGLIYAPYTATKACYDPATELGDQVKIGDKVRSVLYGANIRFDLDFRSDISAPNSEELSSEYPYLGEKEQLKSDVLQVKATVSEFQESLSKLSVTLEGISLYTESEDNVAYLCLQNGSDKSRVALELSVSNNTSSSMISLTAGGVEVASQTIQFEGVVTFGDLSSENDKTTIDAGNIKTGEFNADLIKTGTIDAQLVTLGSAEYGGFCCAEGNDGVNTTIGAKMYGANDSYYFIATNAGVCMKAEETSLYCTSTSIVASTTIATTSDRRKKNNISYDLTRYEDFFFALKPTYYRFNSDHTAQYHLGFIAQDVESALSDSGLSNDDFAGLYIHRRSDDTDYALRYEEFIALNTCMIQQLYQRISDLEKQLDSGGVQ